MNKEQYYCPFCNKHATLSHGDKQVIQGDVVYYSASGPTRLGIDVRICPNAECRKLAVTAWMTPIKDLGKGNYQPVPKPDAIKLWNLIPNSRAKPFPDYIPQPVIQDYDEACSIIDLSPKASATLARRCLQGMIRNFHQITRPRLVDEIDALKPTIDPLVWQAIDAVRKIGNIGAHMEKDVNAIIEIDPGEASKLLELIEYLFKEWYIRKHENEEMLKSIVGISDQKAKQKTPAESP